MSATAAAPPRRVIFNADDLGASPGLNRGIVDCHAGGVVTSASLLVLGDAARDAARLAARHPALAVGLHWDLDGVRGAPVDRGDPAAVRAELERQLALAEALLGHPPTHLDSHHHVHRAPDVEAAARAIATRAGLALRGCSAVRYIGGFYAQWEPGVDDLEHVGVQALSAILRDEVGDGWTEIGCHPGHVDPGLRSSYRAGREAELRTLTDPRVRARIDALGLRLASFAELPRGVGDDPGHPA
ncbi:MAG: hypothetical protein QOJ35_2966 [Solirubrobacteraceae bacterium]|nr:hypothetical protein [Solirubrobacteraceae bacterium]